MKSEYYQEAKGMEMKTQTLKYVFFVHMELKRGYTSIDSPPYILKASEVYMQVHSLLKI